MFSVVQRRNRATGDLLDSRLVAGEIRSIDTLGDRLLLQTFDQCIRIYDPETGDSDELRRGGVATVG